MSKDPTVQQLRCFRVLADELHYGRAARKLHITQPPLTRHIQNLEAAVGVALFERQGRRIELTPAGEAFLADVEIVLGRLDRAMALARQVASGDAGEFVIGYVEPLGIDFLPRILGPFRDLHPHHTLRLLEMHTLEQARALVDGRIDCGLLRTPSNSTTELTFETVWRDELVIAMSERHRLTGAEEAGVRLTALEHEPFVVYDTSLGVGILSSLLAACSDAGFSPTIAHSASSTPMLLALVAANEGVALVSSEIAKMPRPGIAFRSVADRPVISDVVMGWRRGNDSPVIANLRSIIRTFTS